MWSLKWNCYSNLEGHFLVSSKFPTARYCVDTTHYTHSAITMNILLLALVYEIGLKIPHKSLPQLLTVVL